MIHCVFLFDHCNRVSVCFLPSDVEMLELRVRAECRYAAYKYSLYLKDPVTGDIS
jgi:hypothetical protein